MKHHFIDYCSSACKKAASGDIDDGCDLTNPKFNVAADNDQGKCEAAPTPSKFFVIFNNLNQDKDFSIVDFVPERLPQIILKEKTYDCKFV